MYYATESRMYALVILLTGCGFLALGRAVDKPRPGNLIAVAVVTAALLYTQYWSVYLVALVGLWLVVAVWHSRRRGRPGEAPWAALLAVAAGVLLFVPWAPTFVYQAKHTGTPWAAPPNFSAVINALTGFTDNQGSTLQTGRTRAGSWRSSTSPCWRWPSSASASRAASSSSTCAPARGPRSLVFVVLGTLFAAIAGGILTSSAFSSRYAAVVFLPFVLLVALGTVTLLNRWVRVIVVGLAVVAGLVSSAQNVTTQRTQANNVAAAINAEAKPGDVIAFCPDQLGPSVYRQIDDPAQYDMLTFPRRTGPAIVDWVDYADAVHRADPNAFAADVVQRAGHDAPRLVRLGADVPDLRHQVRDDRHRPAPDRHQERRGRAQRRDQPPRPLLRADEPHRVHHLGLLIPRGTRRRAVDDRPPSLRPPGGSTNLPTS